MADWWDDLLVTDSDPPPLAEPVVVEPLPEPEPEPVPELLPEPVPELLPEPESVPEPEPSPLDADLDGDHVVFPAITLGVVAVYRVLLLDSGWMTNREVFENLEAVSISHVRGTTRRLANAGVLESDTVMVPPPTDRFRVASKLIGRLAAYVAELREAAGVPPLELAPEPIVTNPRVVQQGLLAQLRLENEQSNQELTETKRLLAVSKVESDSLRADVWSLTNQLSLSTERQDELQAELVQARADSEFLVADNESLKAATATLLVENAELRKTLHALSQEFDKVMEFNEEIVNTNEELGTELMRTERALTRLSTEFTRSLSGHAWVERVKANKFAESGFTLPAATKPKVVELAIAAGPLDTDVTSAVADVDAHSFAVTGLPWLTDAEGGPRPIPAPKYRKRKGRRGPIPAAEG